jgi:hypothetical protein
MSDVRGSERENRHVDPLSVRERDKLLELVITSRACLLLFRCSEQLGPMARMVKDLEEVNQVLHSVNASIGLSNIINIATCKNACLKVSYAPLPVHKSCRDNRERTTPRNR